MTRLVLRCGKAPAYASGAKMADGQLPPRDASIPGHGKGKGPGVYKLFGQESSLSKAK